MASKEHIRKEMLKQRKSLTSNEMNDINQKIYTAFFNLDLRTINTIHVYLPITKNGEIDTFQIIKRLQKDYPKKKALVSKTNFETLQMNQIYLLGKDFEQYVTSGKWGIPKIGENCQPYYGAINAILIPLLAFDRNGHRVGYGKGFYDRFLSSLRPSPLKIGLCHSDIAYQIDGIHPHDIALDICLTPSGAIYFNPKNSLI